MAEWLLNMLPFEGWRNQPPTAPQPPDSEMVAGPSTSNATPPDAPSPPFHEYNDDQDTEMMQQDEEDYIPSEPGYLYSPRRNIPRPESSDSSLDYMASPLSRQGSLPWSLDPEPPVWITEGDRIAYKLFPITTQPPRIHSQSDPAVYRHIHYTPLPDPRELREEAMQGRVESAMDNLSRYSRHSGRTRTRRDLERTRDRIRHELESDEEDDWDAEPELRSQGSFQSLSSIQTASSSSSSSRSHSMAVTPSPTPSSSNVESQPEPPAPTKMMKIYVGKFDLNGVSSDIGMGEASSSNTTRRRGPVFNGVLLRIPAGPVHLFYPEHGYINGDTPGVAVRKRTYTTTISDIPGYVPASRFTIGKIPIDCEEAVSDAILYEVNPDAGGSDGKLWVTRVMKDLRKRADSRWWIKKVKPVKRTGHEAMVLDD
ncbi:hypothetical protein BKA70DRAFT_1435271 [Coprinopsis sp. MPI-PUGE-AT-0042]|nr:hypothetical protein BKA70DRAFT_1435271 [Coprinopsis sp. MPI-PUGE-AT-0042]